MKRGIFALTIILITSVLFAQGDPDVMEHKEAVNGWSKKHKKVEFSYQVSKGGILSAATSTLVEKSTLKKIMDRAKAVEGKPYSKNDIRLLYTYAPDKAFDGRKDTAWVEGVPTFGLNHGIIFTIKPGASVIKILPGLAVSKWYTANNRPKILIMEVYLGKLYEPMREGGGYLVNKGYDIIKRLDRTELNLEDKMVFQSFKLPGIIKRIRLKQGTGYGMMGKGKYKEVLTIGLTINSVYKGTKFKDTCISEIKVQ